MKSRFEFVAKKDLNKMDKDFVREALEEVFKEGNGFVMIYRNKNENRYYQMTSGFTREEGVYCAHLILNMVMNNLDDDPGEEERYVAGVENL